ncbi:MAG: hypothetical protein LBK47_00670 [Prevotellaceae bacterium]|jgi:hypothetical protein|nr:hypothetical protein [Prevotellaceae bacterium]
MVTRTEKITTEALPAFLLSSLHSSYLDSAIATVLHSKIPLNALIDLAITARQPTSFRSAWILEHIAKQSFELFIPHIPYFIKQFPLAGNTSAHRHFANILLHTFSVLNRKQYGKERKALWNSDLEPILSACFDWLMDSKEKVAGKVACMDCVYILSEKYPWAKDELLACVDFLQTDATLGMLVRLRRLLQKMQD